MDEELHGKLIELRYKYKDIFVWNYENLQSIPSHICENKIEFDQDVQTIKQRRYMMNPTYAARIKEKFDKILKASFTYPVKQTKWLSPSERVLKNNGKLRVCVVFPKLNWVTKPIHFHYFPWSIFFSILV